MPSFRILSPRLIVASLALIGVLALPAPSGAVSCPFSWHNCTVTVSTAVVNDPSVFCSTGHPIIEVTLTVDCPGQSCSFMDSHRICGAGALPVEFQQCNRTFTITPSVAWESVTCGQLTFTVQ